MRLPEGTVVYAVGDIHGRSDLLAEIHAAIRADVTARMAQRRVAVHLGDYVSRGPDSRGVLDMLVAAPLPGFETVYLKGNHESLLLRFLAGDLGSGRHWLHHGGGAVLESYGIAAPEAEDATDVDIARLSEALAARIPPAHLDFVRSLRLTHREGGYLFVHAGIRPGIPLAEQLEGDLLWIRRDFLLCDADHGAVIVHGHSTRPTPEFRANRIGIDTGAHASGRLTCVMLDGDACSVLQSRPKAKTLA